MKKNNIVICGLNDKFNLAVAKILSDTLDMFLLDIKKLLEYEIAKEEVLEKVGIDYLKKLELSALKRASSFENTIFAIDFDNFMFGNNFKLFKDNSLVIFLKFKKNVLSLNEKVSNLNLLNFSLRDKDLSGVADIIIDVSVLSEEKAKFEIIEKLKKEFL